MIIIMETIKKLGAKSLTYFNFPESYIANYNYGNILYQKEKYEEAIEEYKKALKGFPPKEKESSIRINYALAICKTVKLDESDKESIENAIELYESAIDVLTEKGCANKNDNLGHSEKAETLKKDIQDEINRLKQSKNNQNQNNENKDENNNDEEQKNELDEQTQAIEKQIQDLKEQAIKEERAVEDKYKYRNSEFNKNKKNW